MKPLENQSVQRMCVLGNFACCFTQWKPTGTICVPRFFFLNQKYRSGHAHTVHTQFYTSAVRLLILCVCVFSAPVTLDPNTAHPKLIVSDDLKSVRRSDEEQKLPDNPERFDDEYLCILGSEGFNSGTHCWDVEVGDCTVWIVGVMTESAQRKGEIFSRSGIWGVVYYDDEYGAISTPDTGTHLSVAQKLQRIRVKLDWDRGKLSFSDPLTNTHLHTFTHTFTDKLLPVLGVDHKESPIKILPLECSVRVNQIS
ncbi:E3 ubiquitin-protein ligase TRIM39-like [Neoarius graeffei]|uniref:E3 ubiquitin-protein ligase TRIM39-like n=1 Tax=Neoarius graeffei TaxID=443677 RepID=UPI00298D5594|nr:E3 ubiquitin-protein ligase TRIM39-like [Neoarius graeffei]